ncbi:fumarylacetoacetate hydrolase family protein [Pseudogemmobacter humi]|uniref:Ureidoglycolate lyase n=1 Tax=Pseudogemmobacter humi TaxID=2483812 RepID=A0A3P5WK85_9RHOB|nr:fumarylacetoacetate hydrolase family protein [Pseudogemmobacter humi]VDC20161.1 Ureidoglycolate lyase [Pseudogemmobacter humi]
MRLVRYGERGAEKPGLIDAEGRLRDLSAHVPDLAGEVLADLSALKAIDPRTLPPVEGSPRLGACVGQVGKFIGIGLNYADHAAETGLRVPREPVIFAKYTSCLSGPDDPIIIPRGSVKTDWEVELAFVIGRKGRYIPEEEAMSHIAGFCVCNDVSERNYQAERSGQWSKGKSSDNFGPLGPWLVTPDEVADPGNLRMRLTVNGEVMQDGSTATMVFKVPFLVSYLSQFFTLHPGDVVTTGTPPGVGMAMDPPRFLKAGDVVELEVEGLGRQRQLCVDDA